MKTLDCNSGKKLLEIKSLAIRKYNIRALIHNSSQKQIVLSRFIVDNIAEIDNTIFQITDYDIAEQIPELFYSLRKQFGENRSINEVNTHIFNEDEESMLRNMIALSLFFQWDVNIITSDLFIQLDHHTIITVFSKMEENILLYKKIFDFMKIKII
jgi:hypothetical protein